MISPSRRASSFSNNLHGRQAAMISRISQAALSPEKATLLPHSLEDLTPSLADSDPSLVAISPRSSRCSRQRRKEMGRDPNFQWFIHDHSNKTFNISIVAIYPTQCFSFNDLLLPMVAVSLFAAPLLHNWQLSTPHGLTCSQHATDRALTHDANQAISQQQANQALSQARWLWYQLEIRKNRAQT